MKGHQLSEHVLLMVSHWSSKTSELHKHIYILCLHYVLIPLAKTSNVVETDKGMEGKGRNIAQ